MRREIILWVIIALVAASNVVSHVQIISVQAHQNDALRTFLCIAIKNTPPSQRKPALIHKLFSEAHLKPCD